MIDGLFNLNKYERIMKEERFKRGEHTGDYDGNYRGYQVSIRMGVFKKDYRWKINCIDE